MAPDHEARPRAGFYDHESEEPRRRRRPAADWGVGDDIFDRMPSRFSRAERRAEHHDDGATRRVEDAPAERFARSPGDEGLRGTGHAVGVAEVRGEDARGADRVAGV